MSTFGFDSSKNKVEFVQGQEIYLLDSHKNFHNSLTSTVRPLYGIDEDKNLVQISFKLPYPDVHLESERGGYTYLFIDNINDYPDGTIIHYRHSDHYGSGEINREITKDEYISEYEKRGISTQQHQSNVYVYMSCDGYEDSDEVEAVVE